ncbi:Lrp/AsnC family transcriptional regulator [Candidatus Woesearchaeota archaeon]|nr:Lrp/AsnC family transcriptional regulator [Candidatus Woesearchaeota archaeon]
MIGKKDLLIMSLLRKDARMTLTRMSRKINIPISTIYDKLKIHEGSTMKKYTCIVDFAKLGFNARANVIVKSEREQRATLLEYLLKIPNVNSVYKISNGYDYLLDVIFRDIREMEDFFELLESKFSIKDKQVYFVIDDLKREAFLSEPDAIGLV